MELVKGGGGSVPENNWKNRRSQKLEKMELLNLQSNLNSEIQVGTKLSIGMIFMVSALVYEDKH